MVPLLETLQITLSRSGVAELAFSRPTRYNALSPLAYRVCLYYVVINVNSWPSASWFICISINRIGLLLFSGQLAAMLSKWLSSQVAVNIIPQVKNYRNLILALKALKIRKREDL